MEKEKKKIEKRGQEENRLQPSTTDMLPLNSTLLDAVMAEEFELIIRFQVGFLREDLGLQLLLFIGF